MPLTDAPGPASTEPVITISGLSRSFGDVVAVSGLGLSINNGEMFGLVGPDGAGKSTIIRMLVGILTPGAGTGAILGKDLIKGRAALKKDLGYLSQKFSLYGDLSVDENIEFFAELHRVYEYHDLREELLEFTQLKPFRDRLADRLSGGMKQKLALICTLIHRPKIIFLDEPTTGVDPVSRRELWGLLQKLNAEGMTIILCTPYLDEAERCARVAFIHKGELLRVDTPENLRRSVPGRMMEIVCDNPRKAVDLLTTHGGYPQSQVFGDRIRVIVENGNDTRSGSTAIGPTTGADPFDEIERLLTTGGVRSSSHRFVKPSLEDVFIYLMPAEEQDAPVAGQGKVPAA
jgi:ABC-2 type transport system ATP-binding protein